MANLLIRDPFLAAPFRLMDELMRTAGNGGNRVTGFTRLSSCAWQGDDDVTQPVFGARRRLKALVQGFLVGGERQHVGRFVEPAIAAVVLAQMLVSCQRQNGDGLTGQIQQLRPLFQHPLESLQIDTRGQRCRTPTAHLDEHGLG